MYVCPSSILSHPAAIRPACVGLLKLIFGLYCIRILPVIWLHTISTTLHSLTGHQLLSPSTSSPLQWAPPPMHPTGQSAIRHQASLPARDSQGILYDKPSLPVDVVTFNREPAHSNTYLFIPVAQLGELKCGRSALSRRQKDWRGQCELLHAGFTFDDTWTIDLHHSHPPLQFGVIFEGRPQPCPFGFDHSRADLFVFISCYLFNIGGTTMQVQISSTIRRSLSSLCVAILDGFDSQSS